MALNANRIWPEPLQFIRTSLLTGQRATAAARSLTLRRPLSGTLGVLSNLEVSRARAAPVGVCLASPMAMDGVGHAACTCAVSSRFRYLHTHRGTYLPR